MKYQGGFSSSGGVREKVRKEGMGWFVSGFDPVFY